MISIYNASAGTGKTYRLTLEYLKILLLNPYKYKRILAITFTNKAAWEMKKRVLGALRQLSLPGETSSHSSLLDQLQVETQRDRDFLIQNARKCFRMLLHDYSRLSIMTIDSYNIRLFGFLQHIMGDLRMSWQLSYREQLDQSIDMIFFEATAPHHNTILSKWLQDKRHQGKGWDVKQELKNLLELVLNDKNYQQLRFLQDISQADFADMFDQLSQKKQKHIEKVEEYARQILDLLKEFQLEKENFPYGDFYNYVTKKLFSKDFSQYVVGKRLAHHTEKGTWYKKGCDAVAIDRIRPLYLELLDYLESHNDTHKLCGETLKNFYPFAMMNLCAELLKRSKEVAQTFFISDLNKMIFDQIKDEPVPYIYYQSGVTYDHIFVDEFQDTSSLQWQNLLPLVEEVESKARPDELGVLLVGDIKQSIYQFRGGEPDLMVQLSDKSTRNFSKTELHHLTRNYRSGLDIVHFSDRLFSFLAENFLSDSSSIQEQYQLGTKNTAEHLGGFVSLRFFEKEKGGKAAEVRNRRDDWLLDTLKQLKEEGVMLRDIAILVRKNRQAMEFSKLLHQAGFDNTCTQSFPLDGQPLVCLILSFFQMLIQPDEREFYFDFLRNYYSLISPETPLPLSDFEIFLEKSISFSGFFAGAPFYLNTPHTTGDIYQIASALLSSLQLSKYIDDVGIQFLDLLLLHANQRGVGAFLKYWSYHGQNEFLDSESLGVNAVKILTYHKSKGLEFEVVLLPWEDTSFGVEMNREHIWIDLSDQHPMRSMPFAHRKSLAEIDMEVVQQPLQRQYNAKQLEMLNLMYVAATRAKRQLYCSFFHENGKRDDTGEKSLSYHTADFVCREKELPSLEYGQDYTWGKREDISQKECIEQQRSDMIIQPHAREENSRFQVAPLRFETMAQKRGVFFHKALQCIRSRKKLSAFLQKGVLVGEIPESLRDEILEVSTSLNSDERLAPYYRSQRYFIERSFVGANGSVYRPDYVSIQGDVCAVIDYKTGVPKKADEEQISGYTEVIAATFSISKVKKILVYIGEESYDVVYCA